ncbi:ATP-binding protein, partial [Blautia sp. CAG:257]
IRNREELAEALEKLDFPVVIKAVDLMGSRGIFRCDTSEQAFSFYEKTMEATGKDYCLVEEFIEGEPFGCEAMMSEGRLLYCLPNNIDAFQSYVPT